MSLRNIEKLNNFKNFRAPRFLPQLAAPTRKLTIVDQIKKCSDLKDLHSIYAAMIKTNAIQDCFFTNQFISACISCHCFDFAVLAFDQIQEPNAFVYNALIRGFVHGDHPLQALEYYKLMLEAGISPTSFTYSSLVKVCCLASALVLGEALSGHIFKFGIGTNVFVKTALVDFYSGMDRIVEAEKVFDEMPERDVFAWTVMLSGYVRYGNLRSARRLFDEMPERNTASWNAMVDGYARVGSVEEAECLFDQIPEKDIISWTIMVNCYSRNKQFREAVAVFDNMRENKVVPDETTMSTVISACAHLGVLEKGKELHLYLMQNGFDLDVYIGSALVDMYAKCGSLERAMLVFFKLREKNLFCWNSVIAGLAFHGYAKEALAMFENMEKEEIEPNGVTFISVLSACTHAGLVEEGRRMFLSMTRDHSIPLRIEHFSCMVDLLSKAGFLEDALDLIKSMELEPNSVIWGALLAGCKLHKNFTMAEVAVGKLMTLESDNSGYYTLLINMYAQANRWATVTKIRQTMRELRVEKSCPGSSWIEIDGNTHQFTTSDISHVTSEYVYSLATELDSQLKLVKYVPEIASVWSV